MNDWGDWIRTTDLLISSKAQGWLRSDAVPVSSYENRENDAGFANLIGGGRRLETVVA